MKTLLLHKYHSLENDFLILENGTVSPELARETCDRSSGLGADGLINFEVQQDVFQLELINSDGSTAGFSGNGFACTAAYLMRTYALSTLELISKTKRVPVTLQKDGVLLTIGDYSFDLNSRYPFEHQVGGKSYHTVDVGNEHAVFFDTVDSRTVESYFAQETLFPDSININLARILSESLIDLEVIERGCGRTRACTSGALATAIAAITCGLCSPPIRIRQPGGEILVNRDPGQDRYSVKLSPVYIGTFEYGTKR